MEDVSFEPGMEQRMCDGRLPERHKPTEPATTAMLCDTRNIAVHVIITSTNVTYQMHALLLHVSDDAKTERSNCCMKMWSTNCHTVENAIRKTNPV